MERSKAWWGVLAICAALVWSCDSGEMMVDAGELLRDAGDAIVDAGDASRDAADAQVPESVDVSCDDEQTYRVEGVADASETTYFFATHRDPSITAESVREVIALRCDLEYFGSSGMEPPCGPGLTCTGTSSVRGLRCRVDVGAEIEDGVVRMLCGTRSRQWNAEGTLTSDGGQRWTSVRFTIER